jgi:hypothetical protein
MTIRSASTLSNRVTRTRFSCGNASHRGGTAIGVGQANWGTPPRSVRPPQPTPFTRTHLSQPHHSRDQLQQATQADNRSYYPLLITYACSAACFLSAASTG